MEIFMNLRSQCLTISSRSSRSRTFCCIHLCCNWPHFLTKTDLPQNLEELGLINTGREPSCGISQNFPVWWLQNLYKQTFNKEITELFFSALRFWEQRKYLRAAQDFKHWTAYEAKTPLRTYLKGRRTAIATAMSASVMLSPTKKVLGSSARSRTLRTRITSAREFCWIWEHTNTLIKWNP